MPELEEPELVRLATGQCLPDENCSDWRRKLAITRLAQTYPANFRILVEDLAQDHSISSHAAEEYWKMELSTTPLEDREELLWKIFEGKQEEVIATRELRTLKLFAANRLCEYGTPARFDELRSFLTSLWLDVETVVRQVKYCRDRMTVLREYGSGVHAPLAILDGTYPTANRALMLWAFRRLEGFLQDDHLSGDQLEQIERTLSKQAFVWQRQISRPDYTYYNGAWKILATHFGWDSERFREAGLTLPPSPH